MNSTFNQSVSQTGLCGGNMILFRFICSVVITLPVSVFGVIGNTLAFIVLHLHEKKGPTNILLRSLAVLDTFTLLTHISLNSTSYWHSCLGGLDAYMAVYGYIFRWTYPAVYFIRLLSIYITVLLTIERYIAVVHPFQAQHWCSLSLTYKYSVGLGIMAVVFSLPRFFEFQVVLGCPSCWAYTSLRDSRVYTFLYRIGLFSLVMYIIPVSTMVVLNIKLWTSLKKANIRRSSMQQQAGHDAGSGDVTTSVRTTTSNNPSASITVMVVVVVFVCTLCNLAAMLAQFLWSLSQCFPDFKLLASYLRYVVSIGYVFVVINSTVNIAIYCLCSRSFRVNMCRVLRCSPCCPNKRTNLDSTTRLTDGSVQRGCGRSREETDFV